MGIFVFLLIIWIPLCFIPVWGPFVSRLVAASTSRVSSHTEMVLDLLMDTTGWRSEYRQRYHQTGVVIESNYENEVRELEIGGVAVPLTAADKRALKLAIKRLDKAASERLEDEAVKAFAERANHFWREREQQVADIVPFARKK